MTMARPATKTFLHRRRRTSWHPSFRLIYVTGIESSDTFSEESHKQRARILLIPCVRKQTVANVEIHKLHLVFVWDTAAFSCVNTSLKCDLQYDSGKCRSRGYSSPRLYRHLMGFCC
ncbi:hypothetical protein PsorP6_000876 [Peronosclerospora sorghi]|uniref:Uncharacterized protein n=1 Tax=Peronosclerospora sorghi TaxID=230839 RepID=A0ACC0WX90_9STRA|nr:hypothetical protein PsorP6_000876 [Peronosclerospora sorghi]